MASKKGKKIVFTSTSEIYGKNSNIPFSEDSDMVLGPTSHGRWSYACSKAIDEFLAIAYYREKKLPVLIARLFNTIGPRQTGRYGMVVPTFVHQALLGLPITVFGNGKQTRSFTYVKDVVNGLIALGNCREAVGEVFNLGNVKEISIEELAKLIKFMTGSESPITYVSYKDAYEEGFEDMKRRVPDISKVQRFIDYEPTLNIKEALKIIIEHIQKKL